VFPPSQLHNLHNHDNTLNYHSPSSSKTFFCLPSVPPSTRLFLLLLLLLLLSPSPSSHRDSFDPPTLPIAREYHHRHSPLPILMGSSSSKTRASSSASSSTISSRRSTRSDLNNYSHNPTVPRPRQKNVPREAFTAAIDQGTTSSRFLIFDSTGTPRASYQMEFEQLYPHSG
jgi:hypothetical protein